MEPVAGAGTTKESLDWAVSLLKSRLPDEQVSWLEARLLLAQAWGKNQVQLLSDMKEILPAPVWDTFKNYVERRVGGEPLQYILGRQEFMSLTFKVTPAVLIPRWDTEVLAGETIRIAKDWPTCRRPALRRPGCRILDLGTGSGAIAVSLAYYLPNSVVTAVDISEEALEIARQNARSLGVEKRVRFYRSNMFTGLPQDEKYDAIVSNPPYISEEEYRDLSAEVKREPQLALQGGSDGLDYYRLIAAEAPAFLLPQSCLLLEIGWRQGDAVQRLLEKKGFKNITIIKDWHGNERVVTAFSSDW